MKITLAAFALAVSLSTNAFSQVRDFNEIPADLLDRLPAMGIDSLNTLNAYEAGYLNFIFSTERENFDFRDKSVAFITGSHGRTRSNKRKYFKQEQSRHLHGETTNGGHLYVFTRAQKAKSAGYDAVIVYWNIFVPNIDKILRTLSK